MQVRYTVKLPYNVRSDFIEMLRGFTIFAISLILQLYRLISSTAFRTAAWSNVADIPGCSSSFREMLNPIACLFFSISSSWHRPNSGKLVVCRAGALICEEICVNVRHPSLYSLGI